MSLASQWLFSAFNAATSDAKKNKREPKRSERYGLHPQFLVAGASLFTGSATPAYLLPVMLAMRMTLEQ